MIDFKYQQVLCVIGCEGQGWGIMFFQNSNARNALSVPAWSDSLHDFALQKQTTVADVQSAFYVYKKD